MTLCSRILRLALVILLSALTLSAAALAEEAASDEVVFKAGGEVKWCLSGEMGYYTPSGITYLGVDSTEKVRTELEASYFAMLFGSAEGRAGKYNPETMFNAEAEQTVLVGRTDDEASLKALELIRKDEWIIALVDGKLVVTGWYDTATVAAVHALAELVNVEAGDVTLTLPIIGRTDYAHSNLPDMTAGVFMNGMDSDAGSVILRYSGVTEADFSAYAEALTDSGYSLYQENRPVNLGEVTNISATYVCGEDVVVLQYLPYVIEEADGLSPALADARSYAFRPDGTEMRIILQKADTLFPNEEANVYEDLGVTPKMHNVNLFDRYADGNDIGQCTIYTLADGSFLVYDGGYSEDSEQLYRALQYLNERPDGKIVVAAWIFTHDHGDHTMAFAGLCKPKYASNITIEKVVLNKAAEVESWYCKGDPLGNMYGFSWATVYDQILTNNMIGKFAQGDDYQIIVPHFGQVLQIRNANVEILFSGVEDAFPVLLNNDNAASLVTMVTFDDEDVDTRTLILGDHALDSTYNFVFPYLSDGPMHCDIVLTAHHGLGGGTSRLYPICGDPETAIWCTSWESATRTDLGHLFERRQNAALRSSVKVDVMCDEYVHTLHLPFDPDADNVIRTKIGTFKRKTQDRRMDVALLPDHRLDALWAGSKAAVTDSLMSRPADVLVIPTVGSDVASAPDAVGLYEALDYRYAFFAPIGDGGAGHLILSTFPVLKSETGSLGEDGGYAHVLLDVDSKEIDLVVVSFSDAGSWDAFHASYEQWGIHTVIAGNTGVAGDAAAAGLPDYAAAFAEDATVLGTPGITFSDAATDTQLSEETGALYYADLTIELP